MKHQSQAWRGTFFPVLALVPCTLLAGEISQEQLSRVAEVNRQAFRSLPAIKFEFTTNRWAFDEGKDEGTLVPITIDSVFSAAIDAPKYVISLTGKDGKGEYSLLAYDGKYYQKGYPPSALNISSKRQVVDTGAMFIGMCPLTAPFEFASDSEFPDINDLASPAFWAEVLSRSEVKASDAKEIQVSVKMKNGQERLVWFSSETFQPIRWEFPVGFDGTVARSKVVKYFPLKAGDQIIQIPSEIVGEGFNKDGTPNGYKTVIKLKTESIRLENIPPEIFTIPATRFRYVVDKDLGVDVKAP